MSQNTPGPAPEDASTLGVPAVASRAESANPPPPAIPAHHFQWWLGTHALVASIASFFLVLQNATDEPYVWFQGRDALTQVGFGCALILLWIYLIGGTLYGVATRRLHRNWLWLVPWAVIVLYYLRICPEGYIHDILMYLPKSA